MKNVIKAVKKLKLWPKKKKKKKTLEHPPHRCCSCSPSTAQPSAPPLPSSSWLEAENNYGTFLPSREVTEPQDIATYSNPVSRSSNSSYQQYMVSVSEPVYGIPVPVIQTSRRQRSTGQFGCVFSFGSYLFRCLCPCFHIREVV
ncbi:uncharacterized protein LOC113853276 [Abrus precatorius]|uniref:Uncharacterized protein LOC113853276 n=1 Tax=Abrus precatorius TaxID=3816 RepID=A0A8B8K902_ABRPR|nr:uncharacterized protein LOC113853276 [Abrus precatorius]